MVLMDRALYWGGKEVWVVLDKKEGLWRQATVVCAVPPAEDEPLGEWRFILDTRHDSWRHLCSFPPTDSSGREFDHLKLTDAALMPEKDDPYKKWTAPAWFDIVPEGSPVFKIKDGSISVHPYISEEIVELRSLYRVAQETIAALTSDLAASQAESAKKSLAIASLESQLSQEKADRAAQVSDLNDQLDVTHARNAALEKDNKELQATLDDLRRVLNEVQEENNKLRIRLKLMTDELVKIKALCVTQQHDIDEKARQIAFLTRQAADLAELLRLEREKSADLESQLTRLQSQHAELQAAHRRLEQEHAACGPEIDRLRRRPAATEAGACALCEELERLVQRLQREYQDIWARLSALLGALHPRVDALEQRERLPSPTYAPSPVPEPAQTHDDDATRRKRATYLGGQIDALAGRIAYLEELVDRAPAVVSPPAPVGLVRSPDFDNDMLAQLMEMVNFLQIRNDDLLQHVRDARPKFVPTYPGTRASKYDGDFPWLATKQVFELQKENRLLRQQQEIVNERHYDLVNRTDIAVAPVLKENKELRAKIDRYREDLVQTYRRLAEAEKAIERRGGVLDGVLSLAGVEAGTGY